MNAILNFLGTFGKGAGTIVGVITTVVGVVSGLHIGGADQVSGAIHTLVTNIPAVITAIGVILSAFGIGRKAGATINTPPTS